MSMAHQKRTICDTIKERLVTSSVYSMVHAAAKDGRVLSKSDWMEIDTFINELIPNFRNGLYCISEISEQDYRLCLLIRIGGLQERIWPSCWGAQMAQFLRQKENCRSDFWAMTMIKRLLRSL